MFSLDNAPTKKPTSPTLKNKDMTFFSFSDKKPFTENSQQIRNKFANANPVNSLLFAEFAEFAENPNRENLNSHSDKGYCYINQELDSNISGLYIRETLEWYPDDRHFCRDCKHLVYHRCKAQKFRPHDDMPRRCADYVGKVQP